MALSRPEALRDGPSRPTAVSEAFDAQFSTALLVALEHQITKEELNSVHFNLVLGYGRPESWEEIRTYMNEMERRASDLKTLTCTNIANMDPKLSRETSLESQATSNHRSVSPERRTDSSSDSDSENVPINRKRKAKASFRVQKKRFKPQKNVDSDSESDESGPGRLCQSDPTSRPPFNGYIDLTQQRAASSPMKLRRRTRPSSYQDSARSTRDSTIHSLSPSPSYASSISITQPTNAKPSQNRGARPTLTDVACDPGMEDTTDSQDRGNQPESGRREGRRRDLDVLSRYTPPVSGQAPRLSRSQGDLISSPLLSTTHSHTWNDPRTPNTYALSPVYNNDRGVPRREEQTCTARHTHGLAIKGRKTARATLPDDKISSLAVLKSTINDDLPPRMSKYTSSTERRSLATHTHNLPQSEGSQGNPVEIKSESDIEMATTTQRSSKAPGSFIRMCASKVGEQATARQHRTVLAHELSATDPSLPDENQTQRSAVLSVNQSLNSSQNTSCAKKTKKKFQTPDGVDQSSPARSRAHESQRQRKNRRKRERKQRELEEESFHNSHPRALDDTRMNGSADPNMSQESGQDVGLSSRDRAKSAAKKDRQVRTAAPTPAFMSRNIGLTDHATGCGDDLAHQRRHSVVPSAEVRSGSKVAPERDVLTAIPRRHRSVQQPPRELQSLYPPGQADSFPPYQHLADAVADIQLVHDGPQTQSSGDWRLQPNFNQRTIALREQFALIEKETDTLPHQSSKSLSLTKKNENAERPPQDHQGHSSSVTTAPSRLAPSGNRWLDPDWLRRTRSPSGESHYLLWGSIPMRTTWDDEERTMLNSDSDLDITDVPVPDRWKGPARTGGVSGEASGSGLCQSSRM